MARNRHVLARSVLLFALPLVAVAQITGPSITSGYIVRVTPGQITTVASRYGLTVLAQLGGPGSNLYTLSGPTGLASGSVLSLLAKDPSVLWAEANQQLTLPQKGNISNQPASGSFANTQDWASTFSQFAWQGYLTQPAATLLNLSAAHKYSTGAGTVAFLDTGVDFNNPVLMYSLTAGVDFTTATGGIGQDSATLSQSTTSILDDDSMIQLNQSTTSILDNSCDPVLGCASGVNQSTTSILDQSTTSILDNGTPIKSAYGHGTMVAGIIHLVAPTALLMPIKVFGADGTAPLSAVLNGLYYAINNGAKVINLSFNMAAPSVELQKALDAANAAGIICVAAVGNDGQQILVYPAAYPEVIGVASINNQGVRSSFSNYGPVATLAAPGEEIISTYPGNLYAAGWGTSFSTPLVSGAVALLVQMNSGLNQQGATTAISQADPLGQGLGAGELDLLKAIQYEISSLSSPPLGANSATGH